MPFAIGVNNADEFNKYLINVVVVTASVAWLFLLFVRSIDEKLITYRKPFSIAMTLQLFFVTLRNLSTLMLSSVSYFVGLNVIVSIRVHPYCLFMSWRVHLGRLFLSRRQVFHPHTTNKQTKPNASLPPSTSSMDAPCSLITLLAYDTCYLCHCQLKRTNYERGQ